MTYGNGKQFYLNAERKSKVKSKKAKKACGECGMQNVKCKIGTAQSSVAEKHAVRWELSESCMGVEWELPRS